MLPAKWDIFCRVIDNFGDIGVSWRLARQLVAEHGVAVRLWVDHIESLHALCPEVDCGLPRQTVHGVSVFQYSALPDIPQPADIVIEAFGCGLPEHYVRAMTARPAKPLWIILEYLSAENWVPEHHGLPSPHPQLNLPRAFFFPGFAEGTGGVMREADLLIRRDAFDVHARCAWWARHGFDEVPLEAVAVSLFAYPHAPYQGLLSTCARGATPVVMAIPAGPLAALVRAEYQLGADKIHTIDNLELRFLPFLPQVDYDALLWACDINFVRGEDSFVRAQWAGKPFVWHIYPQGENAHVTKLNAFLDAYCGSMPAPAAHGVRKLWHAWNEVQGEAAVEHIWQGFIDARQAQIEGLRQWQTGLQQLGEMTGNLLKFSQKMI